MSRLFSRTFRKTDRSGEPASADLLLRGGFVTQLAPGIYAYLPLAVMVIRRIETLIRREMDALGAQEVIMPVVNPADMGRFEDRSGKDMALAMKESYSLDLEAYRRIFTGCSLPVTLIAANPGLMGGGKADEFIYPNDTGEDTFMICNTCGYAANKQIAVFDKGTRQQEKALPLEKVHTPGAKTVDALAAGLGLPKEKPAKAVFLMATIAGEKEREKRFILALVRGDLEISETKLQNALWAFELRPALHEEIVSRGICPGYGSPIGAKNETVVIDDSVQAGVKFNDADLIGIPVRITVGEKALKEGCLELKLRWDGEKSAIPIERCF